MWFDDSGILYAIIKKTPPISLEENKKSLKEFQRFTGGRQLCMLLEITNSVPSDKATRDWAAEELPKMVKAIKPGLKALTNV